MVGEEEREHAVGDDPVARRNRLPRAESRMAQRRKLNRRRRVRRAAPLFVDPAAESGSTRDRVDGGRGRIQQRWVGDVRARGRWDDEGPVEARKA